MTKALVYSYGINVDTFLNQRGAITYTKNAILSTFSVVQGGISQSRCKINRETNIDPFIIKFYETTSQYCYLYIDATSLYSQQNTRS